MDNNRPYYPTKDRNKQKHRATLRKAAIQKQLDEKSNSMWAFVLGTLAKKQ
jgi:hypothetical protein